MQRHHKPYHSQLGFTLIELLASIAIVGVLTSILYAGVSNIRITAAATKESAAARNLVSSFLIYPYENNGYFPRGKGVEKKSTVGYDGQRFSAGEPTATRWPWKVAGLMDEGAQGLFTDAHLDYYNYLRSRQDDYGTSLTPSFGMNIIFVGGSYDGNNAPDATKRASRRDRTGTPVYPYDYCVTRPDIAYKPSNLIVFASTFSTNSGSWPGGTDVGYFIANPPVQPSGVRWGSYNENIPASMGFIHLRHNDKAVVAHLDGSVALLTEEELRDMRRWSNQAANRNDETFSSFKD